VYLGRLVQPQHHQRQPGPPGRLRAEPAAV